MALLRRKGVRGYSSADVIYDPLTHTSRLPDGRPVPHVTSIISACGLTTDFRKLEAMSPRRAAQVEYKRGLGSTVHADCHAYDDNDLDLDAVHPESRPWVDAFITARDQLGLQPVTHARERHIYHPVYVYTGIQDGIYLRRDGRKKLRVLVDVKTGDPDDAAADLQTAAYEGAWVAEHPGEPIDERWALWLRPGRHIPYTVTNYTALETVRGEHFRKFIACLTVYNEQVARGRVRVVMPDEEEDWRDGLV